MIKPQYINLNMIPSGVMPVLYCSQYDVGRPLGMVVYNGSEAVDLSVYTVTIEGTRTDGMPITAAVTTDGNIGAFTTTATMTNLANKYLAKMVIADSSGNRVASLAFVMMVTPKTMDENAESIEEDASLYQQYTGTVQTLIADIRSQLTDLKNHVDEEVAPLKQRLNGILDVHMIHGTNSGHQYNLFGDCIVISGDVNGIIDFGAPPDGNSLISYLTTKGISKLDFCVITHYHEDHITTNFPAFLTTLRAAVDMSECTFYLPHKGIDWTQGNLESALATRETAVKSALTSAGITWVEPNNEQTVQLASNVSISFYNIGSAFYDLYYDYYLDTAGDLSEYTQYNSFSMVTKLIHNDHSFVFGADIYFPAEKALTPYMGGCDVYKVEHHGLNRGTYLPWVSTLNPKFAMIGIFSTQWEDDRIPYMTQMALAQKGTEILTTATDDINIRSTADGLYRTQGNQLKLPGFENPSLLYGAQTLYKENMDSEYLTDGLIDIDKLTIPGNYYVKNATQFAKNIKPIVMNGNTLPAMGIKLIVLRATDNSAAFVQILMNALYDSSRGQFIAYRNQIAGSYEWTDWYMIAGDDFYPLDESLSNFTTPNINTDRVSYVRGGYFKIGHKVSVYMELHNISSFAFGAGSWAVANGLPYPKFGFAVLNACGHNVAGNVGKIMNAKVYQSALFVQMSGELPYPNETTTIIIQGEYIAA